MTDEPAPTASSDDVPVDLAHVGGAPLNPPGEADPTAPPQAPGAETKGGGPAVAPAPRPPGWRPNYVFLGVVSIISLALDLGTKAWAKGRLDDASRPYIDHRIEVIKDTVSFMFARNRGGAWGLLQDEQESVRRPFFLGISALAIVFIVSLYRKLTPQQWALKWGLPLVLGGALGNLINRVQYNYVVDFIDIRAGWIRKLNGLLSDNPSDHWPTFNVADVAIVAGVILMAVDMFTPRKSVTVVAAVATADSSARAPQVEAATDAAPRIEAPAPPVEEEAHVEAPTLDAPAQPATKEV